jgi:2-C-methyl-D-erythritol 4-phosphate cytidylyltransferase
LRRAYEQADLASTDDAQLVERLGERVVVIEGDPRNLKITRPIDVSLARAILGVRGPENRPAHRRF